MNCFKYIDPNSVTVIFVCLKEMDQFQGRRHSPSPARLTPEPSVEKDEGISDEEDPAELRILLELNEQVSLDSLNHFLLDIIALYL
jgi:hypothetical protein